MPLQSKLGWSREDHDKEEAAYAEIAARDFARKIYEQCDREDELEDSEGH
jgi:hypothetical protein